jgi:signal transduction histidine kinase
VPGGPSAAPSARWVWVSAVLAAVVAVLLGATVVLAGVQHRPPSTVLVIVGRSVSAALFLTGGGLRLARWWMTAEARSAYAGAALVVLGSLTLPLWYVTRTLPADPESLLGLVTRVLGSTAVIVLMTLALSRGDDDSLDVRPRGVIGLAGGVVAGGTLLLLGVWALFPHVLVAGPVVHLVLGGYLVAAWTWVAAVALLQDASLRWPRRAAPLLVAMAVVELFRLLQHHGGGAGALVAASSLTALVAALTAWCALADLLDAAAAEHDRVRALAEALTTANTAATQQDAWREELTHDMRNTVAGLRAALHTLESYDLDVTTATQLRRAALHEVDHVEHLVTGRDRDGELVEFAADDVVRTAVQTRRATGQEVRLAGRAGLVRGRPGDLATVLQNLLVNAAVHAPGSPVTVTVARTDAVVEISVSDRGPGLCEQEATGVFERGARGSRSSGSGLGLYVARSLMQRSGGDVELRNRVDGATFAVLLPAVERRGSVRSRDTRSETR